MRSYSHHNKQKEDSLTDKRKAKNVKVKDKKIAIQENKDDNNPIEYLQEQDINLSKPVMIKNMNVLDTSSN